MISEVYATGMAGWYIDQLFNTHQTIDQIWRSARTFNNDVCRVGLDPDSWATIEMDLNPNVTTNEHFSRAIGGDLTLTSDAVMAPAFQSPFQRVTLGQSDPPGRTVDGLDLVRVREPALTVARLGRPPSAVASPYTGWCRTAMSDPRPGTWVILPTYNEAENLPGHRRGDPGRAARRHPPVVDDGSPDGTGALADSLAAADQRVRVRHRPAQAGPRPGLPRRLRGRPRRRRPIVVQMDADWSHDPASLPAR